MAEESLWSRMAGRAVAADAFDEAWLRHFRPGPATLVRFLEEFDPVAFSCEIG